MTAMEIDFMLKSIRVRDRGDGTVEVTGKTFVGPQIKSFVCVRRPVKYRRRRDDFRLKMLWFEELDEFKTTGAGQEHP